MPAYQKWPLVVIFLSLGLPAFTQPPEDAPSVVARLVLERREPRPIWFEFVPADEGLVTISYMSKHSSRAFGLFKYDARFQRQWGKQIFENTGRREIVHLDVLRDRILVFVTETVPRDIGTRLLLYEYDLNGNLQADAQALHNIGTHNRGLKRWRFERSLNKRQLVAFVEEALAAEPEKVHYYIISAESDSIVRGTLNLPYPDSDFTLRKLEVSNKGLLYVLGRVKLSQPLSSGQMLGHMVFRFEPLADSLVEYPIEIENYVVSDVMFKLDLNENIVIGLFYSDELDGDIRGVAYKRIESHTGNVMAQQHQALPPQVMARYLTPRQIERGRELSNFFLNHLILRSDGGMLMLAEEHYVTTQSFRDMYGFMYSRQQYHFDDILVISFAATGAIEWAQPVQKSQAGEYADELSYAHFVAGHNIYLFYKARLAGFGLNIYYNKIDETGAASTPKPFFRKMSANDVFYRSASVQVSNTEGILVYFQSRGRVFSMLKLEF